MESLPTISAFSCVPSVKITWMSFASPMTWLLVTTMPEASITKPEPSEFERRCCAAAALALRSARRAALAAAVEELLEEILERRARAAAAGSVPAARLDAWSRPRCSRRRRRHLRGEIGERFGALRAAPVGGREARRPRRPRRGAAASGRSPAAVQTGIGPFSCVDLVASRIGRRSRAGCDRTSARRGRDAASRHTNRRTAQMSATPSSRRDRSRRAASGPAAIPPPPCMARFIASGKDANRRPSMARARPRATTRSLIPAAQGRGGWLVAPEPARPGRAAAARSDR